MSGDVLAGVFARGGSKGIPGKNLRPLCGIPLVGYAVEAARASSRIDRVLISTDDPDIADAAREHGAEVPFMRPGRLARDDTPEWLAWRHMLETLGGDDGAGLPSALVSVPPTSPLRAVEDLDRCIDRFFEAEPDAVVTVCEADRNPYFNMVTMDDQGRVRLVGRGEEAVHRRQDAPVVYDVTTVAYVLRPDFVLGADSLFEGEVQAVEVPRKRGVDIDDWIDWELAEVLMRKRRS